MKTDFTCFRVSIAGNIATVVFDRPPVNAQNRASRQELIEIFDALSDREDVRVVVLTSALHVFSAGADIKERKGMSAAEGDYINHNRITREYLYAVADCTKPVIGAINGPAVGAGFALMMFCDIMIAADDAFIQMPEVDVGLSGGMKFLNNHFGRSFARYIYYTAERVPMQELYRRGFIQACVPKEQVMDEAMRIARVIASKNPLAVETAKMGFNVVQEMPERDAYRYEQGLTIALSRSSYAKEAQNGFADRLRTEKKG